VPADTWFVILDKQSTLQQLRNGFMTPAQVAEGERLASEWLAKRRKPQ
jgi:hypothetical protein